jgi:hypothetical protein
MVRWFLDRSGEFLCRLSFLFLLQKKLWLSGGKGHPSGRFDVQIEQNHSL